MISKIGLIYKITCKTSSKAYIGQTSRSLKERWSRHVSYAMKKQGQTHLCQAIRKYGSEDFILEIVEKDIPISFLDIREKFWVGECETNNPSKGYNLTEGGLTCRGWHMSESAKQRISLAQKGRKRTQEQIQQMRLISLENAKKPITQEIRDKISKGVLTARATIKQYCIESPSGEVFYTTEGLRAFCRDKKLVYGTLWDSAHHIKNTRSGWRAKLIKE